MILCFRAIVLREQFVMERQKLLRHSYLKKSRYILLFKTTNGCLRSYFYNWQQNYKLIAKDFHFLFSMDQFRRMFDKQFHSRPFFSAKLNFQIFSKIKKLIKRALPAIGPYLSNSNMHRISSAVLFFFHKLLAAISINWNVTQNLLWTNLSHLRFFLHLQTMQIQ